MDGGVMDVGDNQQSLLQLLTDADVSTMKFKAFKGFPGDLVSLPVRLFLPPGWHGDFSFFFSRNKSCIFCPRVFMLAFPSI
jgi:hypothetical protein